jgi:hypothetical protein
MAMLAVEEYGYLRMDALSDGEQHGLMKVAAGVVDPASSPNVLGLHLERSDARPRALWFVGQVWLSLENEPVILRVTPKVNAAAYQMYLACVRDPLVRTHLHKCISIFWEQPPIPVEDQNHPITLLLVMRYLSLLYDLCQKKHSLGQ